MSPTHVKEFFEILRHGNPHPHTELYYTTPFNFLVAVVLSAQMTDKGVNKVTRELFKTIKMPEDVLKMGETELENKLKTIGLYRTKTKNIMALSKSLIENYGSTLPHTFEDLIKLPGVGAKTANVILNGVFHQPVIAVDTHVFRVANRTGLAPGKTPEDVTEKLNEVVPENFKINAHLWLVLLGRYICLARIPHCPKCPVRGLCEYRHKAI